MRGTRGVRLPRLKRLITKCLLALLIATSTPAKAPDPHTHQAFHGVMSDQYYRALNMCETGGDWTHNTKSYTGLGIAKGTWARWSNSKDSQGKSPAYIVQIADNIAFKGHWSDGVYKPPAGPWGWGCLRHSANLQALICKSRHADVQRWKRGC